MDPRLAWSGNLGQPRTLNYERNERGLVMNRKTLETNGVKKHENRKNGFPKKIRCSAHFFGARVEVELIKINSNVKRIFEIDVNGFLMDF